MSFYEVVEQYKNTDNWTEFNNPTDQDILRIINKETLTEKDFYNLLSPKAEAHIEKMAIKAQKLTQQHFGKVIFLYTPMYLANYCVNQCVYCSFNTVNDISRKTLTLDEVRKEAEIIAATGLRHILILTGESRKHSPVSYIRDCVKVLKDYFRSVSIEIYPLETNEYAELVEAGVDGFTIYQEVYDEDIYRDLHIKGPKRNYRFRLDAPERACMASMRNVSIGALLGLNDWCREFFMTGLHANYLQNKYTDVEISVSLPRIRPHAGSFQPHEVVSDKHLVQMMLAVRLFMPRCGINISTRENASFRDNILGLGVTKMSAGSSTKVGGHIEEDSSDAQFDISDSRNVEEMSRMIYSRGYQPVFKDWQAI